MTTEARHGVFLVAVMFVFAVVCPGLAGDDAAAWARLESAPAPAVDADRWKGLVSALRAVGLSVGEAQACLAPVSEAVRKGLPVDAVVTRLEEGAAKRVDAPTLATAARDRVRLLERSAAMLGRAGYECQAVPHVPLLSSTARALESGVSVETLTAVLALGHGRQSERMRSVVEAGETMCLGGMDEQLAGDLMRDFIQRNLRRMEIARATRFALQQQSRHMENERIRQQLWSDGAAGIPGHLQHRGGEAGSGLVSPGRAGQGGSARASREDGAGGSAGQAAPGGGSGSGRGTSAGDAGNAGSPNKGR